MNVCIYLFIYKQKASFPINVAWTISGDIQVIFIIWSKTKQKNENKNMVLITVRVQQVAVYETRSNNLSQTFARDTNYLPLVKSLSECQVYFL